MTDEHRTYTIAQLADILQVSPATVRNNTKKGAWPYTSISPRIIRFTPEHLTTILQTATTAPPVSSIRRTRRRTT